MAGPLRVLICDDAVGFPSLVRMWLGEDEGMEAVGVVTTAAELFERLDEHAPDVVLLDLVLPDGAASPELVATLRERRPGLRVVLVSSLPEHRLEQEAARVGADARCPKAATPDELRASIRG